MAEQNAYGINKGNSSEIIHWHHSTHHFFEQNRGYTNTAGTLYQRHYFCGDMRVSLLQENLLKILRIY